MADVSVSIVIDQELYAKIEQEAAEREQTVGEAIAQVLSDVYDYAAAEASATAAGEALLARQAQAGQSSGVAAGPSQTGPLPWQDGSTPLPAAEPVNPSPSPASSSGSAGAAEAAQEVDVPTPAPADGSTPQT